MAIAQEKELIQGPIWLKHYDSGVPAEIDPDSYASLVDYMLVHCERYADLPAFYQFGVTLTYQKLEEYSRYIAAYLQQVLKLHKGDRIAMMLPNLLQYPLLILGILRAGLTVVNVNPLYTVRELTEQLKDANVQAIIVVENFAKTLADTLPNVSVKHVIITRMGDVLPFSKAFCIHFYLRYIKRAIPSYHIDNAIDFKDVLIQGKNLRLDAVEICGEDMAFLQYTGGTTGKAKGAILTHRNLVANVLQAHAWVSPLLKEGKEILITAIPLYHIFALTANCLLGIVIGAKNVLIVNPRDLNSFIHVLEKTPFTVITGVNTLFSALLNHPKFKKINFSRLKLALAGGMAVQATVSNLWERQTGVSIIEAYGLTETSPAVAINPLSVKHYNGSIGLPISSTEISIRDEQGQALPFGEVGELWVRGPQVMKGYWQQPAETKNVLNEDGWLKTGDMALMDHNGFLYLVDRKKEMILVSGFNVYPHEIEEVITSHPDVLEAAVIGAHDEMSGEHVNAFIVLRDPQKNLDMDVFKHYLRERLTGYKMPKEIEIRDALPKSAVGKILKKELQRS